MSIVASFQNVFKIPELKSRILFTLGLLSIYRIGAHIPTPGIRSEALSALLTQKGGALMGFFDMFSGGALSKATIFALGIMPYISASIILQLLTVVIPVLGRLAKEGESGRKKITQYTRYGTVVISIIQSIGIAVGIEAMTGLDGQPIVANPGWAFRLMTMITMTSGTAFLMWLGEQITERGIGNGISLIIFAGIVAGFPAAVINSISLVSAGEVHILLMLVVVVIMIGVIAVIVFMERGQRKIPIQYAKRVVGRKVYGGQSTHLPLKVNTAGVIPPIFASSIIMFPATIAGFIEIPWVQSLARQLTPGSIMYTMIYIVMIFFFCYFYTSITFNPVDIADNLKKHGGFIPGVRPGQKTSDFIYKVLARITFGGAIYLAAVCILPDILRGYFNMPFYFGGTSVLIIVGVGLDTISQMESHLVTRSYDGFLKKGRVRGRRS